MELLPLDAFVCVPISNHVTRKIVELTHMLYVRNMLRYTSCSSLRSGVEFTEVGFAFHSLGLDETIPVKCYSRYNQLTLSLQSRWLEILNANTHASGFYYLTLEFQIALSFIFLFQFSSIYILEHQHLRYESAVFL